MQNVVSSAFREKHLKLRYGLPFSYLLFLKRLDDRENAAERQAKRKGTTYQPSVKKEMRWGYWTKLKAEEALSHLKKVVFPSLVDLADAKSSFGEYMKTAECKINKASLLIEACNLIDQMQISQQNQDVQGDTSAGSVQVCMNTC